MLLLLRASAPGVLQLPGRLAPSLPLAVWDTISFASNGLVFFWAGVASINYFIRWVRLSGFQRLGPGGGSIDSAVARGLPATPCSRPPGP